MVIMSEYLLNSHAMKYEVRRLLGIPCCESDFCLGIYVNLRSDILILVIQVGDSL